MDAPDFYQASCCSLSSSHYKYDVFLSFRGEDVRLNYIGHLYRALTRQKGIQTFMDDKSLQRGKSISPEIKKSIQSSRFAIVVFSQNYAKSAWCLEELVEIIRCMDAQTLTVLPIFHGVDPSNVCNLTGNFALNEESFKKDEKDHIPLWRAALTKAAKLVGWDDHNRYFIFLSFIIFYWLTLLPQLQNYKFDSSEKKNCQFFIIIQK